MFFADGSVLGDSQIISGHQTNPFRPHVGIIWKLENPDLFEWMILRRSVVASAAGNTTIQWHGCNLVEKQISQRI
jgi:hypothetical protein